MTRIRRIEIASLPVAVLLITVCIVLLQPSHPASSASSSLPFGAEYFSVPSVVTTNTGMTLAPLSAVNIKQVSISPQQAQATADSAIGNDVSGSASSVQVALGLYTNSNVYRLDAAGSYVLRNDQVPAYLVTFSGLTLTPTLGTGTVSHESVAIDASTGLVIDEAVYY